MSAPLCELFDAVSDPCWVLDDRGQVVYRNGAAKSLAWDPDDLAIAADLAAGAGDKRASHSLDASARSRLTVIRLHHLRVVLAKAANLPIQATPALDSHLLQLLKEASLDAAYLNEQLRSNEVDHETLLARSRGLRVTLNDLITASEIGGVHSPTHFDRIELDCLVQIAWTHVHRSLPKATLHLQLVQGEVGAVYGRQEHLRYVLQAYLMEVAASQQHITCLSIAVNQLGPHVVLTFRSHGLSQLPSAMRPVAPDPDATLAPCQRQTMSFALADRLVSMHKGQVLRRISGGVPEITVQFPSGASALEDSHQLSAQLESYARDLALLFSQAS